MQTSEFPSSEVPKFTFAETLEAQERQLQNNPLVARMATARKKKAQDRFRPIYH